VKKKILIFSHAMELGGAERALIALLRSLDYQEYEADLFLMRHQGELMDHIPSEVNLLPQKLRYACLAVPMLQVLKKKQLGVLWGRVNGKLKAARFVEMHGLKADNSVALEYSHKYTCRYMPSVSDKVYDVAISFLTPHYFVAEKVQAKKKIAWIHTDYSYMDVDVCSEEKMWGVYDHIASISDECSKGFVSKFPRLASKIVRVDNRVSVDFIREQAEVFSVTEEMPRDGSVRLLSVGRFCNAKNFDNVPDICRRLNEIVQSDPACAGRDVKWYLIGFGSDEGLIRQRIQEAGMEEYVRILGKKDNPYPYMKECDLYVQPSRYEGNCVCVHEALALGKMVVITNYATSGSQFREDEEGVIVPIDNAGCAEGLARVIREMQCM